MKFEPSVKMFYTALGEGRILARRCPECGHVEFPPKPACNACGNRETEWCEISGRARLKSIIMPAMMSGRPFMKEMAKDRGGYRFGEVEIEEGDSIHGVCFGVNKNNHDELMARIARDGGLPCHAVIMDRPEGYKTVYFQLDD